MFAAEKWYEYEENYIKYGIDLDADRDYKRERKKAKKAKRHIASAKDRKRAMMYVIVLATVCIGVVIAGAYAASLKYQINSLIASNTEIEKDIETLNVEIKTANNISTIEERALTELGMVYPSTGEIVYVMGEEEPATEFAMLMKDQAYN
ncbi:MAG: hypothetical protein IK059_00455 [Firmicutes bacterium]|nr:hypothetical protein [Bacillota bacterium]